MSLLLPQLAISLTCLPKPNLIRQKALALSAHTSTAPNTKVTRDKHRRGTSDDEDEEPISNPNMNLHLHLKVPALPLPLSQMYDPPPPAYSRPHAPFTHTSTSTSSTDSPAAPVLLRPAITILPTSASPNTTTTTASQRGRRSKPGSPSLVGYRRSSGSQHLPNHLPMMTRHRRARCPLLQPVRIGTRHQRSSSGGGAGGDVTPGVARGKKCRQLWSSKMQTQTAQQQSQNRKRKRKRKRKADYNFSTESDIQGIIMLEILGATDLYKIKNSASHPPSLSLSLTCHRLTDIWFVLVVVTHTG
jgi:hypothetical protein